jgi:hypothetical protein
VPADNSGTTTTTTTTQEQQKEKERRANAHCSAFKEVKNKPSRSPFDSHRGTVRRKSKETKSSKGTKERKIKGRNGELNCRSVNLPSVIAELIAS